VLYTFVTVRTNELGVIAGERIAIVAKGEGGTLLFLLWNCTGMLTC